MTQAQALEVENSSEYRGPRCSLIQDGGPPKRAETAEDPAQR